MRRLKKRHKYKVSDKKYRTVDNIIFASKAEAKRYKELKFLKALGRIKAIELQPAFKLRDGFEYTGKATQFYGKKFRAKKYVADFKITLPDGSSYIEEVKGFETPIYRYKLSEFLRQYPEIDFRVIRV